MGEIVSALPGLAGAIEKGGVIAVLVLIIAVLAFEVRRLRAENRTAFEARNKYRLGFALCKAECDRNGLKPDLSLLTDLLDEHGAPA